MPPKDAEDAMLALGPGMYALAASQSFHEAQADKVAAKGLGNLTYRVDCKRV